MDRREFIAGALVACVLPLACDPEEEMNDAPARPAGLWEERTVEVWKDGTWRRIPRMLDLKNGDVFRLREADGTLEDNDVWVVVGAPFLTDGPGGRRVTGVSCERMVV